MDWAYFIAVALVVAVAQLMRPVLLAGLVWLGRKCLSERVGRRVFGHWWEAGTRGNRLPS